MHMTSRTPEQLLPELQRLRNLAVEALNRLSTAYQHLDTNDPRRVVARHIKAVISTAFLNLIHVHENLQQPSWWIRQGFGAAVANGNVSDELEDAMTLLTASLMVYPFALFEAGLRRVVRAVDPTACDSGSGEFKSIYEWLFKRLQSPSFDRGEAIAFMDLYRNVRNTIHNNGHFYSKTGQNQTVVWRGTRYEFVHGQVPAFIGWDVNCRLLEELVVLNESVMSDLLISKLPSLP